MRASCRSRGTDGASRSRSDSGYEPSRYGSATIAQSAGPPRTASRRRWATGPRCPKALHMTWSSAAYHAGETFLDMNYGGGGGRYGGPPRRLRPYGPLRAVEVMERLQVAAWADLRPRLGTLPPPPPMPMGPDDDGTRSEQWKRHERPRRRVARLRHSRRCPARAAATRRSRSGSPRSSWVLMDQNKFKMLHQTAAATTRRWRGSASAAASAGVIIGINAHGRIRHGRGAWTTKSASSNAGIERARRRRSSVSTITSGCTCATRAPGSRSCRTSPLAYAGSTRRSASRARTRPAGRRPRR